MSIITSCDINKGTPNSFDVVVLGGGPAGLLLASKLGQALNTSLIDKRSIGATNKFWLTNDRRLNLHSLGDVRTFSTDNGTIGTFLGDVANARGDFAVVDEAKLLRKLRDRCTRAGVVLMDNTEALSLSGSGEALEVTTTKGKIKARLLVDASGGNSPVASTFRLHRIDGFYTIYGAHINNIELAGNDIVGAHVLRFGDPSPLFELIPTGPNSAHCVVFVASKRAFKPSSLREDFNGHLSCNPFFELRNESSLTGEKAGVIPIGRPLKRSLPGVVPFGEAAMIQSPLLGAAFNEVLEHVDEAAMAILESFRKTPFGVVSVHLGTSYQKRVNDRLQLMLAASLIEGSLSRFSMLVDFMGKLGPEMAYRLFCTDLRWTDLPKCLLSLMLSKPQRLI